MNSWSATMSSTLLSYYVLTIWLLVNIGAITVSIDRADIKTQATRSSMIANGWRPLTNSYEEAIGVNVSPSSQLEKNVQVHPVMSKFQEHMATSEKLKPLRKGKLPVHEYSPPSILGSFTVFGHAATKARGETKTPNKHVASETREYTFLIPPPKDAYRFELNQHRKPILRDNSNYMRQPQFITGQTIHQQVDPVRSASYFIKGYTSTPNPSTHPANHLGNRPYVPPYVIPQVLQVSHHQTKPFESLKLSNNVKPYFQPPGMEVSNDFSKQKISNDRDVYDRYQSQSHSAQIINSANSGSFYSQVKHPAGHYKSSYERDPAFLVHESHEVSYVTPSGVAYNNYNFRPSLPYETLLPPAIYTSSSTPAPTTAVSRNPSKHSQNNDITRERDYKRPNQNIGSKEENGAQTELPNSRITNTYYVSEQQDLTPPFSTWPIPNSKYKSDINEVLPKKNPPTKFNEEIINQNQIPQVPKIIYRRPHNPYEPIDIFPQTTMPNYETPESISLKHFNEQQFLLQQQLLRRDRERLAEQERQRKLEIERQQREELRKRQEELNQLLQQEKEEEEAVRLAAESVQNRSQEFVKITDDMPYTVQLAQFEPQVTTAVNILVSSEPGIYNPEQRLHPQNQYQEQQVEYRDPQSEIRLHRPQQLSHRRKKPMIGSSATEPSNQSAETSIPVAIDMEDVPIQTTAAPEIFTSSIVTTQKSSSRRPVNPGRRRKISTTTQEPEPVSYIEEDYLKYNRGEIVQQIQYDPSRRRRIKPIQGAYEDSERKNNMRKRPGYRIKINHDDSFDADIITENVRSSLNSYERTTESSMKANENDQLEMNQPSALYGTTQPENQYTITNQPINQYYDYNSQKVQQHDEHSEEQREETTVPVQLEYFTEISRDKVENYNTDIRQQYNNTNPVTTIPLEDLYVKTDGNYYDRATTAPPTTSTTAIISTMANLQPATQSAQSVSSTLRSHKIRPLRYGNATRPRFSIKDYKSRLDYKSRIAQSSTTEDVSATSIETFTRNPNIKQRQSNTRIQQQIQQPGGDAVRETTGRYKYVSRMNYRTTLATPTAGKEREQFSEDNPSSTTEKGTRFVPKRRPISSNVYRSRIASTTTSPTRSQVNNAETNSKQASARPENVYSSSIRRRPVMKSKLPHKDTTVTTYHDKRHEEPTEMSAEETSFYSSMTTTPAVSLVGNIITEKEEAATLNYPPKLGVQENKNEGQIENEMTKTPLEAANENEQISGDTLGVVNRVYESSITNGKSKALPSLENKADLEKEESETETTTKFDIHFEEEELFAKASQSVADLTSSASALYDKPGMFKAVFPETRIVSSNFRITTNEPTLPIEAFFQELSKKD